MTMQQDDDDEPELIVRTAALACIVVAGVALALNAYLGFNVRSKILMIGVLVIGMVAMIDHVRSPNDANAASPRADARLIPRMENPRRGAPTNPRIDTVYTKHHDH